MTTGEGIAVAAFAWACAAVLIVFMLIEGGVLHP